jgi:hypothetical protein
MEIGEGVLHALLSPGPGGGSRSGAHLGVEAIPMPGLLPESRLTSHVPSNRPGAIF